MILKDIEFEMMLILRSIVQKKVKRNSVIIPAFIISFKKFHAVLRC